MEKKSEIVVGGCGLRSGKLGLDRGVGIKDKGIRGKAGKKGARGVREVVLSEGD